MTKKLFIIVSLIFIVLVISGCDFGLGDINDLEVGLTTEEVEDMWGEPDTVYQRGSYVTYSYRESKSGSYYMSYTLYFENNRLYDWSYYRSEY